jgi:uncharacterized peroxidase-related enzyme
MSTFNVPKKEEVSSANQLIFDQLEKSIGFVPNLYAYFAKNETALSDYLSLQNRKSTLRAKEREVINLVTSQINDCKYCQSAHTAIGKMNGFSDDEILEIRSGRATFDSKLDALARLTASVVTHRGKAEEDVVSAFFDAGYNEANLIDVVIVVGDKIMSNYLHSLANFPIDFPVATPLETATA